MRIRTKILISIVILIIGYYFVFLEFPMWLSGPPSSVYSIKNYDDIVHNITVEILDNQNNTVMMQNYTIQPNQTINYDREIRWHMLLPSEHVTWSHGTYTFQFTVDNNISDQLNTRIWSVQTISVWLYYQGYNDEEPTPIEIGIYTF